VQIDEFKFSERFSYKRNEPREVRICRKHLGYQGTVYTTSATKIYDTEFDIPFDHRYCRTV
jgi:hypothetical protein